MQGLFREADWLHQLRPAMSLLETETEIETGMRMETETEIEIQMETEIHFQPDEIMLNPCYRDARCWRLRRLNFIHWLDGANLPERATLILCTLAMMRRNSDREPDSLDCSCG